MQIEYLKEFIELSSDLSFSQTARRLNLSQSSLSLHIIALERELGTQLIDRGYPNRLNAKGKVFLEYATSIVEAYDEARRACRALDESNAAPIRIHKMPADIRAGNKLIKKLLEYKSAHPNANVQLIDDSRYTTRELLERGAVDFGVIGCTMTSDPVALKQWIESGVVVIPFETDEPAIWTSVSSPLAQGNRIVLSDLNGYTVVSMDHALYRGRKQRAQELFESRGVKCKFQIRSVFSEDEFFMSSFKSNEIVFAQKSFFTNMPIVSMRDDMVMKLFDEPVESVFYLGYRQDNTHPLLANIIEFFTQ